MVFHPFFESLISDNVIRMSEYRIRIMENLIRNCTISLSKIIKKFFGFLKLIVDPVYKLFLIFGFIALIAGKL